MSLTPFIRLFLALTLVFSCFGGDETKSADGPGLSGPTAGLPKNPAAGKEWGGNVLKMKFCPLGKFKMGKDKVAVTLTRGFWLGKCEITQRQWQKVMGTKPWRGKEKPWMKKVKEGPDYPATYICWSDAMAFCRKLTDQERAAGRLPDGWKYTLPTEAQWEYACRAGSTTQYSFGDDKSKLDEYAWYLGNAQRNLGRAIEEYERYAGTAKTDKMGNNFKYVVVLDLGNPQQVGKKEPNAWGLHDMHGNILEWCRDKYPTGIRLFDAIQSEDSDPTKTRMSFYDDDDAEFPKLLGGTDPELTKLGRGDKWVRVLRSSAWYHDARAARSADRLGVYRSLRGAHLHHAGFRCALVQIVSRDDRRIVPPIVPGGGPHFIYLKHANAEKVVKYVKEVFKTMFDNNADLTITAVARLNAVIVNFDPEETEQIEKIQKLIEKLDAKKPS